MFYNHPLPFPSKLKAGQKQVVTLLIDHMGIDANFPANLDFMKDPRGILDYVLDERGKSAIAWKVTGNLGGEHYRDLSRRPLNDGGIYPQRVGYYLPVLRLTPGRRSHRSKMDCRCQEWASLQLHSSHFILWFLMGRLDPWAMRDQEALR